MSFHKRAIAISVASTFGGMCLATNALAQSTTVFVGASAGDDRSVYAGATVALPGGTVGSGPAVRLIAATGDYDYLGGPGAVDASYTQIDLSAVYQMSGAWGYANVAAGPRYVETELSPSDPGNDREGERWDLAVAVDGARRFGPWQAGGFASYGVRMEDYYVRADLTRAVGSVVRLGAEAIIEGDPMYDRQKYGAVIAFSIAQSWEFRVSGGANHQADGDRGSYGAVSFSRTF